MSCDPVYKVVLKTRRDIVMHCCVIGGNGFIGQHLVQLPSGVRYVAGDYGDQNFFAVFLKMLMKSSTLPMHLFLKQVLRIPLRTF